MSLKKYYSPNAAQPSRREYEDEFEARGLLFGQNGNLNLLNSLENQEKTLERQDSHLLRQHSIFDTENRHLEHKNHRLERDDRKFKHKHHSLEKEDKSLEHRKHRLEGQDKNLERKRKSLTAEDKSQKGKALEHHNKRKMWVHLQQLCWSKPLIACNIALFASTLNPMT